MAKQSPLKGCGIGLKDRMFEPELYDVIMLNDDHTTMDFVVQLLQNVFFMTAHQAESVMLDIHKKGKGIAGTYDFDTAQSKQRKAQNLARKEGFPLRLLIKLHNT